MKAAGKAAKELPPKLFPDCLFIWEAFLALSNPRNELDSIKFSEIEAYLNLNGVLVLERRQEVAHLIRIMDESYISFIKEKLEERK